MTPAAAHVERDGLPPLADRALHDVEILAGAMDGAFEIGARLLAECSVTKLAWDFWALSVLADMGSSLSIYALTCGNLTAFCTGTR